MDILGPAKALRDKWLGKPGGGIVPQWGKDPEAQSQSLAADPRELLKRLVRSYDAVKANVGDERAQQDLVQAWQDAREYVEKH